MELFCRIPPRKKTALGILAGRETKTLTISHFYQGIKWGLKVIFKYSTGDSESTDEREQRFKVLFIL
jgi:hypothetical protein